MVIVYKELQDWKNMEVIIINARNTLISRKNTYFPGNKSSNCLLNIRPCGLKSICVAIL